MAAINNSAAAENPDSKRRKVESNKEEDDDQPVVGDEDPFERLADETIVEILVRVDDEKSRRRCVALNKRMSCLVPLADPITIDIPPDPWFTDRRAIPSFHYKNVKVVKVVGKLFLPGEYEFPDDKFVFCKRFYEFEHPSEEEIIQYYIKTASENLKSVGAPILQHVTVRLPPNTVVGGHYSEQREPWNLEYSGSVQGGLIKSCAVLGNTMYYRYKNDIRIRIPLIINCMKFGAILRPMVERMVREHDTLCRVSIITNCGIGRLHIGPEEIRNMRGWINNGISSIMNPNWKLKLNMKIWSYGTVGLAIVTDPECHHNTEDVKMVIGSVLDRSGNPKDKHIIKKMRRRMMNIEKMRRKMSEKDIKKMWRKMMNEKTINNLQRMMMKDKETLPPCILQLTNSEWQWN